MWFGRQVNKMSLEFILATRPRARSSAQRYTSACILEKNQLAAILAELHDAVHRLQRGMGQIGQFVDGLDTLSTCGLVRVS